MKFESILSTQSYLNSYLNISKTFNIDLRINLEFLSLALSYSIIYKRIKQS